MKTPIKLTCRFFGILFIASLLLACSNEDGPIGLEGEQGEQGAVGPQGEPGEDGANGQDGQQGEPGNANIIFSDWIPSPFGGSTPAPGITNNLEAPELSRDIMDNGLVLLYARTVLANFPVIYPLPVAFPNRTPPRSHSFTLQVEGRIRLSVSTTDGSAVGAPEMADYRYILIPPDTFTTGKTTALNYSKMSYKEISARFNIPD